MPPRPTSPGGGLGSSPWAPRCSHSVLSPGSMRSQSTVASAAVIGATVVAGGVLQTLHSLLVGRWRGMALSLCSSIMYAAAGLLGMSEPAHGAALLTLLLVMTIVTGGILRVAAVLRSGRIQTRALLLGGAASPVS